MKIAVVKVVVGMTTAEALKAYPEHTESSTSSHRCPVCKIRVWMDAHHDRNTNLLIACPNCDVLEVNGHTRASNLKTTVL